jgi:hypothetical protein
MTNTDINQQEATTIASIADIQNGIDSHNKIASQLLDAAKFHKEAAIHHQNGNHDRAAQSTIKAHGTMLLALESQNENYKFHALLRER